MAPSRHLLCSLLILLATVALCSVSAAYAPRNIRGASDVPSMFFSPFRMMGKRNQFYGLFKKIRSNEVDDY